jgi:hypothetical protein
MLANTSICDFVKKLVDPGKSFYPADEKLYFFFSATIFLTLNFFDWSIFEREQVSNPGFGCKKNPYLTNKLGRKRKGIHIYKSRIENKPKLYFYMFSNNLFWLNQ